MTYALIYHDIARSGEKDKYGFPGPVAGRYKLDPARFEAHLDAIAASGTSVDLLENEPRTALTFDDGGASASHVAEALARRGWRGHFFITTGLIGTAGFVSADEISELVRCGHDVGSHSHSHPTYMGTLGRREIEDEWRRSREVLGEIIGTPPQTAAVPGGFLSRDVVREAARAGYRTLMTSQPDSRCTWCDGMRVQGRFTIWANTSARRAAGYAQGSPLLCTGLWLGWQAKNGPKHLSPRTYQRVRQGWAKLRPQT